MKKPLVSVIVPTRNSEATIGACLKSIKEQAYQDIEIIVIDNNSTDKTKEIARKYTELVFNKGPERSAQRNFGAFKSKGKYLLFIDSDMELSKNVVGECVLLSQKSEIMNHQLGGIIIPEESFGTNFWAKCKALERSFYIGVDWIEAARFFPKIIFNIVDGYDNNLVSGEDWDLNQRIKKRYSIGTISSHIKHNEGRLTLRDLLNKKKYYMGAINNYSLKKINKGNFSKQSNIVYRYKLFFSDFGKLFHNPIIGLGMLLMKTAEFGVGGLTYGFLKFVAVSKRIRYNPIRDD